MNKWRILIVTLVIILSFVFVSAVYAETTHLVRYGDTLWWIARRYGTTPEAIKAANPNKIADINLIYVGDVLLIPGGLPGTGGEGEYIIRYGDTLYRIAWRYGTTVQAILDVNPQIEDANLIYAGRTLVLPAAVTQGSGGNPPQQVSPGGTYIVKQGDGLMSIARQYGTTVDVLLYLNPHIKNKDLIFIGEKITLPGG